MAMNDAQLGVLSLLLEVSATPKPGNVDRDHDFEDLIYEHFVISAVSAYPAFEDCLRRKGSIGLNFLKAVENSYRFCKTNVHFGSFFLLIPLIWCGGEPKEVRKELKRTTYRDSLAVLSAFRICKPRVLDVKDLSLKDEGIEKELVEKEINLYDWLEMSPKENVVAREVFEGYWRSLDGSKVMIKSYNEFGDLNKAIVYTYVYMMSKYSDPLIVAKHGRDVAEEVRDRSKEILKDFDLKLVEKFDEELIRRRINPGSIADLICSSIYLTLKSGEIL